MGKRYRVKRTPGHYVQRNRRGQFKDWTSIPKGINIDKRKKAKKKGKEPGHGHRVDYPKR